ncbi:Cof-type HAD-IIB family hydrolase [Bacillus taeanensis]|uniref:Cof-type HAD-IIB family hydrolase n=1 Tax=Bacillus taeanensis TaxID=273032 RepID=A0A366XZE6_9BACI|nr:Cof-type HAD-IIB family hydrolase [Bacillus taeanensis]RBW69523.1 Cof-type HAD-IIB family hydrolase [Bacillus taeanensis]
MKKSYLIALDLDGTLLSDDKKILPKTKQALKKAMEAGHKIVISTGRPHRASALYYRELKLNTPMVNFNGAYVHHPIDQSWKGYHLPVDLKVAKNIFQTCYDFKVKNIMAEVVDDVYLNKHDKVMVNSFTMPDFPIRTGNLHSILKDHPTSILVHPHEHHLDELRESIHLAHAEVIEHRVWNAPWKIIEIVKSGLNKAVGLKHIAEYYNIPKERVIAFGDESNDLEMIEYAGQGIAMENAIDELKNIANFITKSNEDDGIAHYLEHSLPM